mmetsp:Transcript_18726/g.75269  ORF Transcript_18726/g.75269 Transcript_18726/m.75269 type:complete len:204 (-) Transcript_18726:546-1157(-)
MDNREQESSRFPGTSLCARHQIPFTNHDGDRIPLHWSWLRIPGQPNVFEEPRVQIALLERLQMMMIVNAGHFDRNLIVLVKVYSGAHLQNSIHVLLSPPERIFTTVSVSRIFKITPRSLLSVGIPPRSIMSIVVAAATTAKVVPLWSGKVVVVLTTVTTSLPIVTPFEGILWLLEHYIVPIEVCVPSLLGALLELGAIALIPP